MNHRRMLLASTVSFGLAPFMAAGADTGKPILKSKELKELVRSAKTAADHERLSRHYLAVAEQHDADASEHESLAQLYAKNPLPGSKTPMGPNTVEHCKFYAEHCRRAAKEMRTMAEMHQAMAKTAQ